MGAPLASLWLDVGALVAMMLIVAQMMRTPRTISRAEGALLLCLYATFLGALIAA